MTKATKLSWAAALCITGFGAYSYAQPQPGAAACGDACPMHQAAALSDVKVEQTKQGAVIKLVAKRPEDVAKVQQSAQQMAAMLSSGSCPMHAAHAGNGDMHQHHHQHHHNAPAAAPTSGQ